LVVPVDYVNNAIISYTLLNGPGNPAIIVLTYSKLKPDIDNGASKERNAVLNNEAFESIAVPAPSTEPGNAAKVVFVEPIKATPFVIAVDAA